MLNIANYSNKTEMIRSKLKEIDRKAMEMYDSGEYTLEEIEFSLKASVSEVLQTLELPSMKTREALTAPIFEDYRDMVNETIEDTEGITEDCKVLERELLNLTEKNGLMRRIIWSKIERIRKNSDRMVSIIGTKDISRDSYTFTETFASSENTESGNASVDMFSGVLTLNQTRNEKADNLKVRILEGSDGFPGNTHEAYRAGEDVIFQGEDGIHADLNAMIDGRENSWFEYENISVSEETLKKTGLSGFLYKEGIPWITEKRQMSLLLEFELTEEKNVNRIVLKPFLARAYGTEAPIIRKIVVISADRVLSQTISAGESMDSDKAFFFREQPVKRIVVEMLSSDPYETQIGHYFFSASESGELTRKEGPSPSISPLGMRYSAKERKFLLPESHNEDGEKISPDENHIREEYFGLHMRTRDSHKETLPAERFMIGIKELSVSKSEYRKDSTYISRTISTKENIVSVSLESEDYVPSSFGVPENYLKYYISFDEGKEWHQIFPRHRSHSGPSVYRINSAKATTSAENAKLLYRLEDTRTVKMKIEISRPEAEKGSTPVVRHYSLKIKTGDEVLD